MQKYTKDDIECGLSYSYQCFVNQLLKKYGPVSGDYFLTESCKSPNTKIKRASEGLFIHHIDENKAVMLSRPAYAKLAPFKYQKANRLVYCNLLEHLILHCLIFKEYGVFGLGGAVNFIIPEINDYYAKRESGRKSAKEVYSVLEDNFDGYISILADLEENASWMPGFKKKVNQRSLSKGTDGKVVDIIYEELGARML